MRRDGMMGRSGLMVLGLVVLGACASGPDELTMEDLAGQYVAGSVGAGGQALGAFEITTFINGEVTDWIARGARFDVNLLDNGNTTGRLFIPGGDEDGGDLDMSLEGTWELTGSIVRLAHEADTFARDMDWEWQEDRLVGDETFTDVRVRVELVRR